MDTRPPGVYIERAAQRAPGLGMLASGVPCFLGLTERGPTSRATRVTSLSEFRERFGQLDVESYLDAAVDGFFLNGGTECYIVRIAHLFERGRKEIATKASVRLRDAKNRNTLTVQALAEGMWGNQVRVSVRPSPAKVQTFITVDAKKGEHSVMVKSTYGFSRGSLVKVFDDDNATYRVLTRVDGRTLWWNEREPLDQDFRSMAPTMIEPVGFDVIAQTHSEREVFTCVNLARQSPFFVERVINGHSQLIEATNLDSHSAMPDNLPVTVEQVSLDGGTDGLYTVTAEDFIGADLGPGNRYGLAGIAELEEIDLVVAPDLPWCMERSEGFKSVKDMEIVQQAIVSQCEEKKDRFAILDLPPDQNPRGAMQWRRLFNSSFAAFYYPYVVPANSRSSKPVPPSGHVAGIFSRCDQAEGVYRAPANEVLEGVVDLELFLQQKDIAMLNAEGINCSQVFAQRGIRVWGARTTSADTALRHVNVRRTIIAITRALNVGLQWVVFENNDQDLWQMLSRDVAFFLDQLWRDGYLKGDSAEDAYSVRCNGEINSLQARDQGRVNVDIWLAPFRPAEFLGLRVTQEVDVLARGDGA
ncbi:MAG: phage tail sheath family protein [Myxococcales bacterium]|nr:phage tail sheath family protein [Myxococcales bacterium]